jgi:uncharacterized protein YoaH (UPF0181 family)
MCDKCQKFQADIERYQKLMSQGLDALTIERIETLIQELRLRKAAMQH